MMRESIGALVAALTLLAQVTAPTPQPRVGDVETAWSGWLAEQLGGEAEVAYSNAADAGRADILTTRLAIEVEWPKKSKLTESLEQAARYRRAFSRHAAVIFLVGRGNEVAEKAMVSAVDAFGREKAITVVWLDVRDPDLERLRRQLGVTTEPAGQD